MFTTKHGYTKLVSGIEYETNRSTISATKLDAGDEVVQISILTATDALNKDMKVIILTQNGLSLGYSLNEVTEMKKTGRGVKAIALDKNDFVDFVTVQPADQETFVYRDKTLNAKKVRNRKRGQKGQKAQL